MPLSQTPARPPRWWEFVTRTGIHCGPAPFGHHIPNTFKVNESGFIQCGRLVPMVAEDLRRLDFLREQRLFREADQWRIALAARGVIAPADDELKRMVRDAKREPCGRWIFALAIRGGGIIEAEVSLDEMRLMEDLSTPTEMLDYLGIMNRKAG